jgi:anti-sigma-K factor RskA/sigma-70-like protein
MASIDNLPADQRAVLELVLQRGQTYDEIAKLLSVDRAGVRQRALAAFDAIGPHTRVPAERRALIADYLLGQLPPKVSESVRERLGSSSSERTWARMLAAELAPLAREPLPEIPVAPARAAAEPVGAAAEPVDTSAEPVGASAGSPSQGPRRSSRVGGAVLLGAGALVVIAVVLVLVLSGGGNSANHSSTAPASGAASATPAPTSGSSTTSTTPKVVGQVNLLPSASAGQAKGIAQVISVAKSQGIVIYATGMPANTKQNFYEVWLYNSPSDDFSLGFVNPGVSKDGRLQTTGQLPTNVAHYKQLIVSLETQKKSKTPTNVVLQGGLALKG